MVTRDNELSENGFQFRIEEEKYEIQTIKTKELVGYPSHKELRMMGIYN